MFSIPRKQPGAPQSSPFGPAPGVGVAPGAFSPIPGVGVFGAAPTPAAPTPFSPPAFPIAGFNPTPPAFLSGAAGQPAFGPPPGGPFGQIAALGSQGFQRPPTHPQPAMQIWPGSSVFTSPAGSQYQPSGQFIREPYYQAPIDPAYRSRSIEIEATGRGPAVHSSTACSSNLAGLAQRLSYMLSGSPTDDNVRLALNTLENCLNERTRAAPASGMNTEHKKVYDLIDKLGRFIADYYTNAGAARGGMNIQFISVFKGFQVTLNNRILYNGNYYSVFGVQPDSVFPVRGGKRKGTRRAKRKASRNARKTRARK